MENWSPNVRNLSIFQLLEENLKKLLDTYNMLLTTVLEYSRKSGIAFRSQSETAFSERLFFFKFVFWNLGMEFPNLYVKFVVNLPKKYRSKLENFFDLVFLSRKTFSINCYFAHLASLQKLLCQTSVNVRLKFTN